MNKCEGYIQIPLNSKPYAHTNFPVTKDGTKALFRVLGGEKTIDAVEPHLTFALHVTVDPWRQEEDPCVLSFFIYKTKINYVVDFSVHKSQYVKK